VITVVDDSRFVGQSQFTPMLPGDDSLVPYGEDSTVMIRKVVCTSSSIASVLPYLDNGVLVGCTICRKYIKETTYHLKNSSGSRRVDTFYIDHRASSEYGGYVISTDERRIKSVVGFSRYELPLRPGEETQFKVEEEVIHSVDHRGVSDIERLLASRTIGPVIPSPLRRELDVMISHTRCTDLIRRVCQLGTLSEEEMASLQSFLSALPQDDASLPLPLPQDTLSSLFEIIREARALSSEISVLTAQAQVQSKSIQSITDNQKRLRDNLERLKEHGNSALVRRYLDDMNADEDKIIVARKALLELEAHADALKERSGAADRRAKKSAEAILKAWSNQ